VIGHDLAVVDRLAHDVAVLRNGVLQEMGPHDQILHSPKTEHTHNGSSPHAGGPCRIVRRNLSINFTQASENVVAGENRTLVYSPAGLIGTALALL
jgi:ABC-type glutathione transport system ATPase component